MAFQYTGQFNGYVAKATGQVIAFARDPKKYKLNKYTQLVKSDTELGTYYLIHPDDTVRLVSDNANVWMDGAKRPERTGQRVRHKTAEFACVRRDYDFQIGWRTLQTADYKVLLANTNSAENEAMIAWTKEVIDLAETATNWGNNTANAVDLAGGATWDAGTANNPVIKKSLLQLAEQITLLTNGVAADFENADDVGLVLVLNPQSARRLASTPEIHSVYKESLYAEQMIGKSGVNPNAVFGLPARLYGYTTVVETAVIVSERAESETTVGAHQAATTGSPAPRRFVKSFDSAIVASRPGGIDGTLGAPNFSTIQRYYVGSELKVKIFDEAKHEYTDGHVERFGVTKLAAPASGFLVTNILAPE
jgi:hypothetical protein